MYPCREKRTPIRRGRYVTCQMVALVQRQQQRPVLMAECLQALYLKENRPFVLY